jgi:hypothetical protein
MFMPRKVFLFIILLFAYSATFSQSLDSLLEIQRQADPQEKIYVQFDKDYYNPGETIWYKAYLFTGIDLSVASKNLYAELVDEGGNVLLQSTSPVVVGGAMGSMDIDSAFARPVVYFRAYTTTMLNGDTSFLFTKAIRILTNKPVPVKVAAVRLPTLQFMPEGGDWIAGIPGQMAFLTTNQQGGPIAVSGTVKDNAGTKVADFATLQNGMGRFPITPEVGKTYTAAWKDEAGKTFTTPLPPFKTQGVSLKLTDEDGNRRFTVQRTEVVEAVQQKLHVIGYMNQRLVFAATVNLANRSSGSGIFPTKDLPSGILQVTVFDSSYKPLAERITFINNRDYEFDADVFLSQKNLSKRSLNVLEVTMNDTVSANLSLSVTDNDLNERNTYDDNIVSHLLLTGDLRGKIVNPYYYFFSTSDSAPIHLDLVMLTHGWRRYNWDNVLAGKVKPDRWKESNYLSLNGQLAGMQPGSIAPDLQLTGILQTPDSAKTILNLPVNRQGKVFTDELVFFGNARLYFNFNKKNMLFDKGMLTVDNGLRKGYTRAALDSALKNGSLPEIDPATIANNRKVNTVALNAGKQFYLKSHELGNVTVKGKVKTPVEKMEETYVSGLFGGDARGRFDLVNDPLASSYMSIFQYLQGKVAGLQINTGAGTPTLSWRGGTPSLYLNEMKVDANMLSNTPVTDIAYVKVFSPGDGGSFILGGSGAIAVYTRKGGDQQPDPNAKSLSYVQLNGYSAIKQFYSPDYATASERDAYDDVRSTLYWNPFILLDKSRKHIRIQFYNNDITKHFRLVMEGVNNDGKLLHVEKEIL